MVISLKTIDTIAKYSESGVSRAAMQFNTTAVAGRLNFGRLKLASIETDIVTLSRKSPFETIVDEVIGKFAAGADEKKILKSELMDFNVNEEFLGKPALDKLGFNVRPYINNVKMPAGMGSCNPYEAQINVNTHPKFLSKENIADLRQNIKNCEGYAEDDIIKAKIVQLNEEQSLPVKYVRDYSQYHIKSNELSPQMQKILVVLHEGFHMRQNCEIADAIGVGGLERFLRKEEPNFVFDKFTRRFYESNTVKPGAIVDVKKQTKRAEKLMESFDKTADPRVDFKSYWCNLREIEARKFENKIMKMPLFQTLEEVFQKMSKA